MSRNERTETNNLRRVFMAQYSTALERKNEVLDAELGTNRMVVSQALLNLLVSYLDDFLFCFCHAKAP